MRVSRRTVVPVCGAGLLLLGAAGTAGALWHWRECFGGMTAACVRRSDAGVAGEWLLLLWLAGLVLAVFVVVAAAPGPLAPLVGVGVLLVVNPLTELAWGAALWGTADTAPFAGAGVGIAVAACGVAGLAAARPVAAGSPAVDPAR